MECSEHSLISVMSNNKHSWMTMCVYIYTYTIPATAKKMNVEAIFGFRKVHLFLFARPDILPGKSVVRHQNRQGGMKHDETKEDDKSYHQWVVALSVWRIHLEVP